MKIIYIVFMLLLSCTTNYNINGTMNKLVVLPNNNIDATLTNQPTSTEQEGIIKDITTETVIGRKDVRDE